MKKRYWLAILCAVLALTAVILLPVTLHTAVAEGETSGQCGDDLFWEFDKSTGTLTITGSGEMYDYYTSWEDFFNLTKTIDLPDGLTSIGHSAFYSFIKLSEITIPDSVTRIGNDAFSNCKALKAVTIPDGVTEIASGTFSGCTGLTSVTIPDSVTVIRSAAFSGCSALAEVVIPDGVASIGYRAFYNCTGLEKITMPCSTSLGNYVFDNCTSANTLRITNGTREWRVSIFGLEAVTTVILDEGITGIGERAFAGFSGSAEVTVPNGVTTIGNYAFYETKLTGITIPDSVSSIGENAFEDSTGLKEITIPGSITDFGDYAFRGCTGLETVTIGNGVTEISMAAFSHCTALREIMIPESVTRIDHFAFEYCTGLEEFTIPDTVTSIGQLAFQYCTELKTIVIGDGITGIEEMAFKYCSKLETVNIGNNIVNINEFAFFGCESLREVTLPDSVITISDGAFSDCTELEEIIVPDSVISIGEDAFKNCSGLKDVWYGGTPTQKNAISIADGNDCLLNATWHYAGNAFEGTVEWNAEDVKYRGSTPYVIANGSAQTPRFTVKNTADGSVVDPKNYDFEYKENTKAGTGYVIVTFKGDYEGTCRGSFKIYLQPTTTTTVANIKDGIKLTWSKVEGADGYVIYRRAWSSTTNGWTDFVRWNNTTALNWTDTKVYAGTRYQYGIKAYFNKRLDPVTNTYIGGNVGDNYNLGEVGPLKTTVRITTRVLNSVTAGTKQMTVKWGASSVFTGYQIKYATDENFTKNVVAFKITDPKTAQTVIKNLKTGTTYYVTVRSYHEFNGMTYFGEWSNVLSCKVK